MHRLLPLSDVLPSAQAFTSLSLFTVLRMPLFQLPQLISQVINARVALNRIQAFLAADEQPDLPLQPPVPQGQQIRFERQESLTLEAYTRAASNTSMLHACHRPIAADRLLDTGHDS
jgi:ABC-type siderophore export system fused ATPase/permease subunit